MLTLTTDLVGQPITLMIKHLTTLANQTHSINLPWMQKISEMALKKKLSLTAI